MNTDINNLDDSEKNRILEMHKKHGYSLSEQETIAQKLARLNKSKSDKELAAEKAAGEKAMRAMMDNKEYGIPGTWDNTTPGGSRRGDIAIPQTIEIGGSLFKNGIANIDRTNTGYKDAIAKLKKLSSGISVDIIGGASKVGSDQGFNNQKLAMLRATNFIKAAQSDGVTVTMTPSGEVGVEKVKDSPAAEKEQFVKIEFIETGRSDMTTGRDATSGDIKKPVGSRDDGKTPVPKQVRYKVCIGGLTKQELSLIEDVFKKRIISKSTQ
jgi:hypothetical protein